MVDVEEVGNKMQSQMRLHAEPDDAAADLPLPALFDRASRLHALASSSALDQVPLPYPGNRDRLALLPLTKRQRSGERCLRACFFFPFPAAQDGIRTGVELLRRCDEMVGRLGLFSPNETKDDVSTANLKYLLVCPSSSPSICSGPHTSPWNKSCWH